MNDGIYYPYGEERFNAYKRGMLALIEKIKTYGAKVIVMTLPTFDADSFTGGQLQPEGMKEYSYMNPYKGYSEVLKLYGEWIIKDLPKIADKVIDLYTPVLNKIHQERSENPGYIYGDGIHPDIKEHWVIAKTLLRELFSISLEREPGYLNNENGKANIIEQEIRNIFISEETGFMDQISIWRGFKRHDFYLNGREGIFIEPQKFAAGNSWVWRMEFLEALQLLIDALKTALQEKLFLTKETLNEFIDYFVGCLPNHIKGKLVFLNCES